ncbi:MAG TPA: chemotaxis protein CheA [Terriglobales bacterium]|nr:chemotaxis protein CheA [Terriglobales bacterium]
MEIDNELLLKSFVTETGEGLVQMEQALLELELHPEDVELVNTVFRVVHTFKGNAAIFDLKFAQEFAHALEDLLDRVRTHDLSFTPDIADVLLSSIDVLRELTAAAAAGRDSSPSKYKQLLQRVKAQSGTKPAKRKRTRKTEDSKEVAAAPIPQEIPREATSWGPSSTSARTLRVDVQKLDRLLDLTGEIAIARGRTTRLLENREQFSIEELAEAHSIEAMLQAELQELVMKVRMVPVGPLFRQYQRTVRDLAKELGKIVNLQIEGDEVEVDTSVVEHLRDPLLHMIRNALDHGIELPEQRRKAGKPVEGVIALRASHQSGNISVEVADDGAGLSRAKILEAAKKRGVVMDATGMTDDEVYQLVFESGLSTAEQVSSLSGRGVGMDVVRRNVQALRGSVSIESRPGMGSTVHLRFPLTLAIIEGFAVEVGGNTYVIPLDHVIECLDLLDLPAEERSRSGGAGVINLRGEPLPYIDLGRHFGCTEERNGRQSVIVVRQESQLAGLVVDKLHGETQTVIKPLGEVFEGLRWAAGSAILGNGKVALILDTAVLLQEFCKEKVEVA